MSLKKDIDWNKDDWLSLNDKNDPRWVPDASVTKCLSCSVEFSKTKRKHHCRKCGGIVCSGFFFDY